jgi:hypothetical protein
VFKKRIISTLRRLTNERRKMLVRSIGFIRLALNELLEEGTGSVTHFEEVNRLKSTIFEFEKRKYAPRRCHKERDPCIWGPLTLAERDESFACAMMLLCHRTGPQAAFWIPLWPTTGQPFRGTGPGERRTPPLPRSLPTLPPGMVNALERPIEERDRMKSSGHSHEEKHLPRTASRLGYHNSDFNTRF